MKRNRLAVLTALTALPAAVIVSTVVTTVSSTSAQGAPAISRAFLTDSGDSGQDKTVTDVTCNGFTVVNPNPGQNMTFTVTGPGVNFASTSNESSFRMNAVTPSSSYTVTMTPAGGSATPHPVQTPAC